MNKWEERKESTKAMPLSPSIAGLVDGLIQAAEEEITDYADKLRLANAHIAEAEEEIAELNELLSDQAVKNIDLEKEITQLREDLEKAYGRALNAIKENGEHR